MLRGEPAEGVALVGERLERDVRRRCRPRGARIEQNRRELRGAEVVVEHPAAYDSNGVYHVFGISPAGALYQRTWNGSWSDWQNLGGTITGTPAVTYHNGRFDVFAIGPGSTHAMYQKTYDNGWGDWHSIGGDLS
jgi:hypothetical protein